MTIDQPPEQALLSGARHPRERQQPARRRSWAPRRRAAIATHGQLVEPAGALRRRLGRRVAQPHDHHLEVVEISQELLYLLQAPQHGRRQSGLPDDGLEQVARPLHSNARGVRFGVVRR